MYGLMDKKDQLDKGLACCTYARMQVPNEPRFAECAKAELELDWNLVSLEGLAELPIRGCNVVRGDDV